MNKAIIAVRSHSKASSASRLAVLLILASYSSKDGDEAFPKWDTLSREAKTTRKTVSAAIKEALANGEIECTGKRKSKTKIYSFAPIIHSSLREPKPVHGSLGILRQFPEDTKDSSLGIPDQAVDQAFNKKKKDPRDATLTGDTGLSVSSSPNGKARMEGKKWREERSRRERELASLTARLKSKPDEEVARRVAELRSELNGAVRRGEGVKELRVAEELRESV